MSFERVVFFNAANNGDIFVSRALVEQSMKQIRAKFPQMKFAYCHRNPPEILHDVIVENPDFEIMPLEPLKSALSGIDVRSAEVMYGKESVLVLNTWYPTSPIWGGVGGQGMGMTLNTLVELFRAHLRDHFGLALQGSVDNFIPDPRWGSFYINNVDKFILSHSGRSYHKLVLFSNGSAMSGQTAVTDEQMTSLLELLAVAYPDALFICTAPYKGSARDNIAYSGYIIGDPPWGKCDLNETAYLGTYCDVVVGRCSGPQSFCFNKTFLTDRRKTMVSFSTDERPAKWVYMSSAVKADLRWSPSTDDDVLFRLVSNVLEKTEVG